MNHRDLTKVVTRLENGALLPQSLYTQTGRAHIVGITGPPGVGKSSLIDRLIDEWRRHHKTVAVVAIDPSSPISGGALLGDRLRMQRHSGDKGVFIRSLATRHHHGGLTDATPQIVHALDGVGFDVVIVETVGAGQDEVEVAEVADTVVVVLMPELGDEIQRAKSGLMEIADILVINKSDLLREAPSSHPVHVDGKKWQRPTIHTSAKTGADIPTLCGLIEAHHQSLVSTGELAKRRARAARAEVIRLLQSTLAASIIRELESPWAQTVLTNVAERSLDPGVAVGMLTERIFKGNHRSLNHGTTSRRRKITRRVKTAR